MDFIYPAPGVALRVLSCDLMHAFIQIRIDRFSVNNKIPKQHYLKFIGYSFSNILYWFYILELKAVIKFSQHNPSGQN
jgi:hypothetical protein